MKNFNFHNQGQSLIGIIIVLIVVGLISGGLYYYFSKQISEAPEIPERLAEEEVIPEEIAPKEKIEEKPAKKPIVQKCVDGTLYEQCSANKPKYCDNGNLLEKCSICGCSSEQRCQGDGSCKTATEDVLVLGEKVYILQNGDTGKKIDLLFIPYNVSDFSKLESKINDILYKTGSNIGGAPMVSLFTLEPFKDYKNEFNVAYMNKNMDRTTFACYQSGDITGTRVHFLCDDAQIKKQYQKFNPDYIIVIFNEPGSTSSGGEIQYFDYNLESSDDWGDFSWQFVHEFGHQFGGLVDEYNFSFGSTYHCGEADAYSCFENYEQALNIYPNVDTLGCPKWCENYDINKFLKENEACGKIDNEKECLKYGREFGFDICVWFNPKHPFFKTNCVPAWSHENIGINCKEGTQCIFGADYGQLAFDAGGSSIMSGGLEFTKPSRDHLRTFLECFHLKQAGERPKFCQEFIDKFSNIPSSAKMMSDFRTAYEKIIFLLGAR